MSEAKPKIEGAEKFRQPMRAAGQPTKKEFVTKVLGLESHTFDIGNMYKKTVDAIANYIQREYKGGASKGNQRAEPCVQEDSQCDSQLHTERV